MLAGLALAGTLGCGGNEELGAGASCDFSLSRNEVSATMPTVGVVEWSLSGSAPSSAAIVYRLRGATSAILNSGGEAPVNLSEPNHRTLLLGLKQASDYTFHVEARRNGRTCSSPEYSLPTTGSFPTTPAVTVTVAQAHAREPGFIVTSSGTSLPSSAFILDADGDVVWYAGGPENPTRAQLDYEGRNMWMLELNLTNELGEMRALSMDGERELRDVPGFETAHHDFTVLPGGRVAALAWRTPGIDAESELVVRSPDGTLSRPFAIGNALYRAEAFHANAIHYVPFDDGFTIADRNANAFVKVSATGALEWQLGGRCDGAPAGSKCSPQAWDVVHGHHLLEDGTFVLFNNTYADVSRVLEFRLNATPSSFTATLVEDHAGAEKSQNLGDVQRLPGGNTLVTYATAGKLVELDANYETVQTFAVRVGYASFRPTLYGPPARP
ncbi:MAG TPA: arylsulfotransferase family protein [Polyangiaceae bacterium]